MAALVSETPRRSPRRTIRCTCGSAPSPASAASSAAMDRFTNPVRDAHALGSQYVPQPMDLTREETRLRAAREGAPWRLIGPYLSERQWGTVREDYSDNGDAWSYFSHDQSRSRAYRWGEDGLAGQCDEHQRLCLALALWNEQDPILKERLFGLTNNEGNHGEDVKEYYFYLDSTPTHSYMKMLYKYPHRAFPYSDLVQENAR